MFNNQVGVIKKILNNSALVADYSGREYILLGQGIAFGKKQGMRIPNDLKVEKIFEFKNQYASFSKVIQANEATANYISDAIQVLFETIGVSISERAFISFCDHVALMYNRSLSKEFFANPFIYETKALYSDSFQLAINFKDRLYDKNKIDISLDEVALLALHIQNFQNDKNDITVMQLNEIIFDIKELLEHEYHYDATIYEEDYARFITHIKFLIRRTIRNKHIKNELLDVIQDRYSSYSIITNKIAGIIENKLCLTINEDEKAFLAVYIARFLEI